MNGKFILLLVISINIVALLVTAGFNDYDSDSTYSLGTNYIFDAFFSEVNTSNFNTDTSLGFNNQTSSAIADLDKEQSSGSFTEILSGGVSFILDGLKMGLALFSLLTPIPLIAFFGSLGFPFWLQILLAAPLILLYVLALFEFITGRIF